MNTKKETRKASLILWAASLAFLMQQPLQTMEKEDSKDKMPSIQQLTLGDVSEDEMLSMSEGAMADFEMVLDNSNPLAAMENYGEEIKSAATQITDSFNDLNPDIYRHDPEAMKFEPSIDMVNFEYLQAQNMLAMLQQPMDLMAGVNNNFSKYFRNKDRQEHNKDREKRRVESIAAGIAKVFKENSEKK